MASDRMFTVIEFNQASGRPDSSQSVELFEDPAEAQDVAADLERDNRENGRREHFVVYELVEVERGD